MLDKVLIIISGICKDDYGLKTVKEHPIYSELEKRYDRIVEIRYQDIMDRHALLGKTLLDPIRLLFTPSGWAAEKHIKEELRHYCEAYKTVDVLTHSLGSWIVYKCKEEINNLFLIASPVGFLTPLARTVVRLNIFNPKIKCNRLFSLFSTNDPVSKRFPIGHNKWTNMCKSLFYFNTRTKHDLSEYLDYLMQILRTKPTI